MLPRYDILQRCFVWPHGSPRVEPWRSIVYNISSSGLGITMPFPPQPGTDFSGGGVGLAGGGEPEEVRCPAHYYGRIPVVLRLRIHQPASIRNIADMDFPDCGHLDRIVLQERVPSL